MFVLDTNVASELMRPAPAVAVAAWIAERDAGELFLTAISEAELLYGTPHVAWQECAELDAMERSEGRFGFTGTV